MTQPGDNRTYYAQVMLTYPQCDETKETLLNFLQSLPKYQCSIVCKEDHHETMGKHLHAWVKFTSTCCTRKWSEAFDFNGHHGEYQKVTVNPKSIKSVVEYVTKDGDWIEDNCSRDLLVSETKRVSKYTNNDILNKTEEQLIEEGIMTDRNAKNIVWFRNYVSNLHPPADHKHVRGIWLYDKPRTGKSTAAHVFASKHGGFYNKLPNKWWNDYRGQKVVVIEELDHEFLNTYLKYWADKFTFPAEIKGGQIYPDYDWLIVCSNYSLEEIVGNNKDGTYNRILDAAIRRRFALAEKAGEYWTCDDIEKACSELETRDIFDAESEAKPPSPKQPPTNENPLESFFTGSGYE